tara:strand:+ start:257 stop:529 length:273 start_codon:yes stop_codon:yes gene_type:complete
MKKSAAAFNEIIDFILGDLFLEKVLWNREEKFFYISDLLLIPLNWIKGMRRNYRNAELQYSQISGSNIKDHSVYLDLEIINGIVNVRESE